MRRYSSYFSRTKREFHGFSLDREIVRKSNLTMDGTAASGIKWALSEKIHRRERSINQKDDEIRIVRMKPFLWGKSPSLLSFFFFHNKEKLSLSLCFSILDFVALQIALSYIIHFIQDGLSHHRYYDGLYSYLTCRPAFPKFCDATKIHGDLQDVIFVTQFGLLRMVGTFPS